MRIRPATVADLDAIMALENASFHSDAWTVTMMREELASPLTHYVVAEAAGRVLGYAGLRAPQGARDADIQTIALSEDARGRGHGRALLRTLLHAAAARSVREVFLDVRADNRVAHTLYASEGFADAGRRRGYYRPDDVDAVVMRLDVRAWQHARGAPPGAATEPAASGAGACT